MIDPQPLSNTANGGNSTASITLKMFIICCFYYIQVVLQEHKFLRFDQVIFINDDRMKYH